jgi:branched-chain amino acid transport system permease protein
LGIVIASLAAAAIPVAIAVQITNNTAVSLPPQLFPVHVYVWGSVRIANIQIIIIAAALLISTALAIGVQRTTIGRALRALAFDRDACALLGISADRLAMGTMFVSGALAGGAGVLLAIELNVLDAHMGEPLLLQAFAVIILGGVGSVWGALVSSYLLAVVETFMVAYVSANLEYVVAFGAIIVLLLLRPQGLLGRAPYQRA